jgi:hypothetical protein
LNVIHDKPWRRGHEDGFAGRVPFSLARVP